jgi:transcription elongation factor GreB
VSKAFTRESDQEDNLPLPSRQQSSLPPGARNYLTPEGEKRLRVELERLIQVERPTLAVPSDDPDRRRQLQILDQRIAHLQQSLQTAVVVENPPQPWEQVRFGASVTVRDSHGEQTRYRIVGIDEADVDRDWVSWCSPIAKALLNARIGHKVRFRVPAGEQELEIIRVEYEG